MTLRLTILGSGSSGGVPRLGNHWGACDPSNPRNRRLRCALLVERFSDRGATRVLVDSPPDIREQLLAARVAKLDAVLYTHDHADHTHGIDDLRVLAHNAKRRVDVYFDAPTRDSLVARFNYCFMTPQGSSYPPILKAHDLEPGVALTIEGAGGPIPVLPILQQHGDATSLGFRFGRAVYSPDISDIPEASLPHFTDMDVWIVDALRYVPHPSHFSVKEACAWVERLKPRRTILTHLHVDLDYAALQRELPPAIEPAFDGLQITLD
ncbi:MAG: MBL fold metallo-hydrolase [Hyphomicrobiaceae bacterium]|nr:MBL fold metallo-hydrolase [Hyphomicrobiaceae bacterium]